MNIILILLILACSYIELSCRFDTDNIIEKISIFFIVLGAIFDLNGINNLFIELGACVYFILYAYKGYHIAKHKK